MLCIFLKGISLRNSLKKTPIKNRWKINCQFTKNKNIHFCILRPLVLETGKVTTPKSIPTFIQYKGSMCTQFRRICQLDLKWLCGNHSVYRQMVTDTKWWQFLTWPFAAGELKPTDSLQPKKPHLPFERLKIFKLILVASCVYQ